MTEREQFDADARQVRKAVIPFLWEWYGDKCPEYHAGCVCCDRWKALELLTENPFEQGACDADESKVAEGET